MKKPPLAPFPATSAPLRCLFSAPPFENLPSLLNAFNPLGLALSVVRRHVGEKSQSDFLGR
jgi:hypothetical protein